MTGNPSIESSRGWYVVAGAFLILTFGFGSVYSFGTFFAPLQDAFGASRASVSAAFSLAVLTLFIIGPVTGTLADRLGPRALVAGGTALVGIGLIVASFAQALWQVQAAFAVCIGVGVGMSYVPAAGAVQKWFDRRRGLASGIAIAGIGVGTLAVPPVAAALIEAMEWRLAFFVIGLAVAVAGGAAGLLVASPGSGRKEDSAAKTEPQGIGLATAVRSRPFLLMFTGFLLASLGMYTPIAHLVPYAEDRGISPQSAALLLSLLGVGSAVGRFAIGAAADRIGRWRGFGSLLRRPRIEQPGLARFRRTGGTWGLRGPDGPVLGRRRGSRSLGDGRLLRHPRGQRHYRGAIRRSWRRGAGWAGNCRAGIRPLGNLHRGNCLQRNRTRAGRCVRAGLRVSRELAGEGVRRPASAGGNASSTRSG